MLRIRAILFDLIGTTVLEKDPTVINACFEAAFSQHGFVVQRSQIQEVRGLDKKEAIDRILADADPPAAVKAQILESFKRNVEGSLDNFVEHPAFPEIVHELHRRKIPIGIASGLPHDVFQPLMKKLQWHNHSLAYTNVYERCKQGRPHPEMIFTMCSYLNIDPQDVLKVGDTLVDIQEGKNAGAYTAAVLAGTQPRAMLLNARPDFIFESLQDVIHVLA
ncbi:MAG TPA: HAD family hydrolase [Chryseosolibacter sp.]